MPLVFHDTFVINRIIGVRQRLVPYFSAFELAKRVTRHVALQNDRGRCLCV